VEQPNADQLHEPRGEAWATTIGHGDEFKRLWPANQGEQWGRGRRRSREKVCKRSYFATLASSKAVSRARL
jgi:hypothetical protein